jgi:nucleotide-binding universal stress UspA family protein
MGSPAWASASRRPASATTARYAHWFSLYNSVVMEEEGAAFELGTDGPKVILVGVDDSVTSLRAGAYAAGLARRQGARLVCVYVTQLSALYGAAASAGAAAITMQEEALQEASADMRQRTEEYAGTLGVPVTFITACGDPFTQLRRVADEVRADAVIVGASSKAGHRWVGSLAVRLVKAGRWPVTVVP